jgi:hypothetical protein
MVAERTVVGGELRLNVELVDSLCQNQIGFGGESAQECNLFRRKARAEAAFCQKINRRYPHATANHDQLPIWFRYIKPSAQRPESIEGFSRANVRQNVGPAPENFIKDLDRLFFLIIVKDRECSPQQRIAPFTRGLDMQKCAWNGKGLEWKLNPQKVRITAKRTILDDVTVMKDVAFFYRKTSGSTIS